MSSQETWLATISRSPGGGAAVDPHLDPERGAGEALEPGRRAASQPPAARLGEGARRPEQQQEQRRRQQAEDEATRLIGAPSSPRRGGGPRVSAVEGRPAILPREAGEGDRAAARWRGRAAKPTK